MSAVYCANDRCPQFVKTSRRRYIGEGTKLQCSKCRAWTVAQAERIMLSTATTAG